MKQSSNNQNNKLSREAIIGLGEASVRKNYYSELQGKIIDLERLNSRNRAILNTIPDILMLSDQEGNLTPFTTKRKQNNPFIMVLLKDKKIVECLREGVILCAKEREMQSIFFDMVIEDDVYHMEARINHTDYEEFLIIVRDITEPKNLELRLRHMAEHDSLTNLFNRRIFEKYLGEHRIRKTNKLGIIIIDIDGLKMLNDTLGHLSGDEAIRTVAREIESVFGEIAITARLSGDEFGILLENYSEHEIERKIKLMISNINAVNATNETLKISISYGYAVQEEGELDVEFLYSVADNHMYQNKMFKSASVRSSLVKTLMKALQAKDFITEGHADRMSDLATALGEKIALSRHQIDRLHLLAKFHDIGKVGIPDSILNKPGKLDSSEFKVMKTHTHIGKRIALESVDLKDIADFIYYHHERWDGDGYPEGLLGADIPIECRILSIVDTFDAMTNDRPYRKALSEAYALEEITENAGKQFDPSLVEIFVEMMENKDRKMV